MARRRQTPDVPTEDELVVGVVRVVGFGRAQRRRAWRTAAGRTLHAIWSGVQVDTDLDRTPRGWPPITDQVGGLVVGVVRAVDDLDLVVTAVQVFRLKMLLADELVDSDRAQEPPRPQWPPGRLVTSSPGAPQGPPGPSAAPASVAVLAQAA